MTAEGGSRRFALFGFATTHAALDAERVLLDLGVPVTPVPAPKGSGMLCGIALRLDAADAARAAEYLDRAGIEVARKHLKLRHQAASANRDLQ